MVSVAFVLVNLWTPTMRKDSQFVIDLVAGGCEIPPCGVRNPSDDTFLASTEAFAAWMPPPLLPSCANDSSSRLVVLLPWAQQADLG